MIEHIALGVSVAINGFLFMQLFLAYGVNNILYGMNKPAFDLCDKDIPMDDRWTEAHRNPWWRAFNRVATK